eukprot:5276118-Amphidinium_carterae.1
MDAALAEEINSGAERCLSPRCFETPKSFISATVLATTEDYFPAGSSCRSEINFAVTVFCYNHASRAPIVTGLKAPLAMQQAATVVIASFRAT